MLNSQLQPETNSTLIDIGQEYNIPQNTVYEATFGDTVETGGLLKYRGTKDKQDFLSIISDKIIVVSRHYMEGYGFFYCFKGDCCKDLGLSKINYAVAVAHYTTYNTSKLEYGSPISYKYWLFGPETYEFLKIKSKINGSIVGYDLLLTCTDSKYQKIQVDALTQTQAVWTQDQEQIGQAILFVQQFREIGPLQFAKSIANNAEFSMAKSKAIERVGGDVSSQQVNTASVLAAHTANIRPYIPPTAPPPIAAKPTSVSVNTPPKRGNLPFNTDMPTDLRPEDLDV